MVYRLNVHVLNANGNISLNSDKVQSGIDLVRVNPLKS